MKSLHLRAALAMVTAVLAVGATSCANGAIGSIGSDLQCGPDARVLQNIENGTANSLILTEAQKMAIGSINISRDRASSTAHSCSGTLISPSFVLTAKHCTNGDNECFGKAVPKNSPCTEVFSGMFFRAGPVSGSTRSRGTAVPDHRFRVKKIHFPPGVPESDLAIVELTERVTDRYPQIQPLGITKSNVDDKWSYRKRYNPVVSQRTPAILTELAGFGDKSKGRDFAVTEVWEVFGRLIRTYGGGNQGPCGGDSGGPLIVQDADGVGRVVGSLFRGVSGNKDICTQRDDYNRVDRNSGMFEWVSTTVCGPNDRNGNCIGVLNSCSTASDVNRNGDGKKAAQSSPIETFNRCTTNTRLVVCNNGIPEPQECRNGLICGWDTGKRKFGCIRPSSDPCDTTLNTGKCGGADGNTAIWCDVDKVGTPQVTARLMQRDCTACGKVCALIPGVGVDCRASDCGNVDSVGVCNGNVATWCSAAGKLLQVDCQLRGTSCGDLGGTNRCLPLQSLDGA